MNELPPLMIAKIRTINRDQKRLEAECKVRLNYGITVLNDSNRLKFALLVEAELHPDSLLGKWVKDMIWNDKQCFEKMNLTSLASIDRDNRALEQAGLFTKEKEQPKVVQQMTL